MRKGFYTALGTPLNEKGEFLPGSFVRQVEEQLHCGASGLLVMGSMGIGAMVKNSKYRKVAKAAADAVRGSCPVFVGVADASAARVKERIYCLSGLKIDGVVSTIPYYETLSQDAAVTFFRTIADGSPFPVYLYDLPSVTKTPLSYDTVVALSRHDNIRGIKTGNLVTARKLLAEYGESERFETFFSNLDLFDVASRYGIVKNLDGMFSCTAPIARKLYDQMDAGNWEKAAYYLDQIISLRDVFVRTGIFPGFTCAMNLLGYEGSFSPDYAGAAGEEQKRMVGKGMRKIGMLQTPRPLATAAD